MAWTDALSVLEKLAPMLATGLGGPLAGGAVSMLEGVFGLTPAATATTDDRQASIAAAISGATPDQLLALKKADLDYSAQMTALGFKDAEALAALAVQDRSSARQMQISTKSITAPLLASFITMGFFGTLATMMFITMPVATHDALMLMLGSLGTAWTGVVAYYFGSSAGSDRKTELLAQSPAVKE